MTIVERLTIGYGESKELPRSFTLSNKDKASTQAPSFSQALTAAESFCFLPYSRARPFTRRWCKTRTVQDAVLVPSEMCVSSPQRSSYASEQANKNKIEVVAITSS